MVTGHKAFLLIRTFYNDIPLFANLGSFLVSPYSDYQKSVPIKLASLLILIAIGCCFDSLSANL